MTRWSQLKKAVESLFAEKVRGRVELRATSYGHNHHKDGRGYITIDKEEIWKFCSSEVGLRDGEFSFQFMESIGEFRLLTGEEKSRHREQKSALDSSRRAEGVMSKWEYYIFLFEYLSMPHASALESDNIIFLAMAILDRRLGKRRIPDLRDRYQAHPLLKRLYDFRCEVEGVIPMVKPQPA